MKKIDLRKDYKTYYSPSLKAVQVVKIPAMKFLMVDGMGDPRRTAPSKLKTIIRQPIRRETRS